MQKEIVLNWNKELGWSKNPFTFDIQPVEKLFSGKNAEKDQINLFIIKNHDFGVITGTEGSGKTMLLSWVYSQISMHKNKIIPNYLDYNTVKNEKDFVRKIVHPFLNGFEKLGKKHLKLSSSNISQFLEKKLNRNYLILIDNLEDFTIETHNVLKKLKENPKVKIVATRTSKNKLSELIDLEINLGKLNFYDARILVEKRIKHAGGMGIWPFNEEILEQIFQKAGYNAKKILELCESKAIELSLLHKRGELKKPSKSELKMQAFEKDENKKFVIKFGSKKKKEIQMPEEKPKEEPKPTIEEEIKEEIMNHEDKTHIPEPENFETLKAFELPKKKNARSRA